MIEIVLSEMNRSVIRHALLESYAGYAGEFLRTFLNADPEKMRKLSEAFKNRTDQDKGISLALEEWRLIIETINAVVYELGAEELQTLTGHELNDFLNTGRTVYAKSYGRTCALEW